MDILKRVGITFGVASLMMVSVFAFGAHASAATIFSDGFGTGSTDSTIGNSWSEGGSNFDDAEKRAIGSGNDSASPDGGRFAIAFGTDSYICRTVDTTGYTNVQLSYYWRGDSDSGSASDNAEVEIKPSSGATCSNTTGWTNLADHDLRDDASWLTQSPISNSGLNNGSFLLKFRTSTNAGDEHLRVDGVLITGDLIPLNQTITFGALSGKTYGDADFSVSATASSALPVTFTASGSCSVAGNTVHIDSAGDCTVTAHQAGNGSYNPAPDVARTFTVAQKSLTPSITASGKVYDGTDTATVTSCSLATVVGMDDVTCSAAAATFDTKHFGTGKTVTATGITLGGAQMANYTLGATTATALADISQRTLTVNSSGGSRVYNAATSTTVVLGSDKVNMDDVTLSYADAYFDTPNVAMNIPLHVVGISITGGTDGGNYVLANTTIDTVGNITTASATVTLGDLAQTYNATPRPVSYTVDPSGLTVVVTYDGFATVPTNAGSYAVVATVNDANYAGTAMGTLVVAKADLTITALTNTKVYNGTTAAAAIPTVVGLQGMTDSVTALVETYDTATAGTGKTLSVTAYTVNDGNMGNNYNVILVADTTGVIEKADQTISFGPLSPKVKNGADFSVSAIATSGLTVAFTSSTLPVCTVAATTVSLELDAVGTCTINANQAGDVNYNAAPERIQSFEVLLADTTPPVITVTGSATVTIIQNSSYTELGATAQDNVDGTVPVSNDSGTVVTPTIPGTYTVTYTASDSATPVNTATATRTVIVTPLSTDASLSALSLSRGVLQPVFSPSILLYHANLPFGTESLPGIFATTTHANATKMTSNVGGTTGTSTVTVTAENGTDTREYVITFSIASAPDTTAPVITVLGSNPASFTVNGNYTDAGATATDEMEGDLTLNIVATSTVNASLIGTYSVVYSVSDQAGNTASSTRTVNVVAPIPGNSGGGSGNSGGGSSGGIVLVPTPVGNVLGASTSTPNSSGQTLACSPYITSYIIIGAKNNPAQVTLLQEFLNKNESAKLTVNGVYNAETIAAVRAFQVKHADKILAPWGIKLPTGNVYFTTLKVINEMNCTTGQEFVLTPAQLREIARVRSLGTPRTGTTGAGASASTSAPAIVDEQNPVIGAETDNRITQTAGIGNASSTASWWGNFVKWFSGN